MTDIGQMLDSHDLSTLTVDDFFSQINWSGVSQQPQPEESVTVEVPYKTVGQFFATLPWQGAMSPASVNILTTDLDEDGFDQLLAQDDALTLDDLSALF